jgi:hypothetical protein
MQKQRQQSNPSVLALCAGKKCKPARRRGLSESEGENGEEKGNMLQMGRPTKVSGRRSGPLRGGACVCACVCAACVYVCLA